MSVIGIIPIPINYFASAGILAFSDSQDLWGKSLLTAGERFFRAPVPVFSHPQSGPPVYLDPALEL